MLCCRSQNHYLNFKALRSQPLAVRLLHRSPCCAGAVDIRRQLRRYMLRFKLPIVTCVRAWLLAAYCFVRV